MQEENLKKIVRSLIKDDIKNITIGGTGANSRIYKVDTVENTYALKFYRDQSKSQLSRLEIENQALKIFSLFAIKCVPKLITNDKKNNCSLLEWIEGDKIKNGGIDEVNTAADFLKTLHDLRQEKIMQKINIGTEACLNADELVKQLYFRINNIERTEYKYLKIFIKNNFIPKLDEIINWSRSIYIKNRLNFSQKLVRDLQTLSPVDFGFHNMLRKKNNNIVFIDFEYFGWADPVNLISDTLLHPGMNMNHSLEQYLFEKFINIYGNGIKIYERLKALFPLYGLRWCLIMMNEFLPEYKFIDELMTDNKKKSILDKKFFLIQEKTNKIAKNYKKFPYAI